MDCMGIRDWRRQTCQFQQDEKSEVCYGKTGTAWFQDRAINKVSKMMASVF